MIRAHRGRLPVVDPTAFIDETAQVIGEVEIGPECSLWMNVVVRGDVNRIRIGARTNLQDATVVHVMRDKYETTIGNDVTVGHGAILHGCVLADRVLVGMGALVLNGATIGEDTIVAAGSLVTERAAIPPRSLVLGRPARVQRALTAEEVSSILRYAQNYVRYRLDYWSPAAPPAL